MLTDSEIISIYNIDAIVHRELTSTASGERFSLSAVISAIYNFKDLFVTHDIILPGRKSSSPHCHSQKEEMIVVLAGNPTLFLGNQRQQLKAGDFIGLEPCKQMHYLQNHTSDEVQILTISSNPHGDIINYLERN